MTTQVLVKIKEAEREVEMILAKAQDTKKATVSKARQNALRHVRETEEKARDDYLATTEAAKKGAEQESLKFKAEADKEVAHMRTNFEAKVGEARGRIIQLFERVMDAQD